MNIIVGESELLEDDTDDDMTMMMIYEWSDKSCPGLM